MTAGQLHEITQDELWPIIGESQLVSAGVMQVTIPSRVPRIDQAATRRRGRFHSAYDGRLRRKPDRFLDDRTGTGGLVKSSALERLLGA